MCNKKYIQLLKYHDGWTKWYLLIDIEKQCFRIAYEEFQDYSKCPLKKASNEEVSELIEKWLNSSVPLDLKEVKCRW